MSPERVPTSYMRLMPRVVLQRTNYQVVCFHKFPKRQLGRPQANPTEELSGQQQSQVLFGRPPSLVESAVFSRPPVKDDEATLTEDHQSWTRTPQLLWEEAPWGVLSYYSCHPDGYNTQ